MKKTTKLWARAVCIALVVVFAFSLSACNLFSGCDNDDPTAPGKPQGLVATAQDKQISLTWEAADDGGSEITKYQITYKKTGNSGVDTWTDAASSTAHTVADLTNGTEYTIKVRAVNSVGAGEAETVTATPAIDESIPRKLTADRKKIINDAMAALEAAQTLSVEIKNKAQSANSSGFNVITRMMQKKSSAESFSARLDALKSVDGDIIDARYYYLLATDENWYRFNSDNELEQPTVFSDKTAAEQHFKTAAAEVYGLVSLADVLDKGTATLTTDDGKQIFTIYNEANTLEYTLAIADGKVDSLRVKGIGENPQIVGYPQTEIIEMTFSYTLDKINEPADWQNIFFGNDGAANTVAQLVTAIKKAVDEKDTWDSTDAKVIKLSAYTKYAEFFRLEANGKFVFDESKRQSNDLVPQLWEAFFADMLYVQFGINFYSDGLYEQLKANPLIGPHVPDAFKYLPDDMIRSNIGLAEDMIGSMIGITLDDDAKREFILLELEGSYVIVKYGRVTEYASNGGQDVVKLVYNIDLPGETDGKLSTTNRNILNAAKNNFASTKTWEVNVEATAKSGVQTEYKFVRTGEGENFSAALFYADLLEVYYGKASDGVFYTVWYGTEDYDELVSGADAEAAFMDEFANSSPVVFLDNSNEAGAYETFTDNTTGSIPSYLFTYEYVFEQDSARYYHEVTVINGKITAMTAIFENMNASGAVIDSQTRELTVKYTGVDIDFPADWEKDLPINSDVTTPAKLRLALNYTAKNPDLWDSTAHKVFTLKNFADYAPYFLYDEASDQFVLDIDSLNDSAAFAEMWKAYKIGYVYAQFGGADLYSAGLYAQLEKAPEGAMLLGLLGVSSSDSDEKIKDAILKTLDTNPLSPLGQMSTAQKRIMILSAVSDVYIRGERNRISEYMDRDGQSLVKIRYYDDGGLTSAQIALLDGAIQTMKSPIDWGVMAVSTEYAHDVDDTYYFFARAVVNGDFQAILSVTSGSMQSKMYFLKASNGRYYLVQYTTADDKTEVIGQELGTAAAAEQAFLSALDVLLFIVLTEDILNIENHSCTEAGNLSTFVSDGTVNFDSDEMYQRFSRSIEVQNDTGRVNEVLLTNTYRDLTTDAILSDRVTRYIFEYRVVGYDIPEDWEGYAVTTGPVKTIVGLNLSFVNTAAASCDLSDANAFTLATYQDIINCFAYDTVSERFVFDNASLNEPSVLSYVWNAYLLDQFYSRTGVDLNSSGLYDQIAQTEYADRLPAIKVGDDLIRPTVLALINAEIGNVDKKAHLEDAFKDVYIIAEDSLISEFVDLSGERIEITYNS